MQALAKVGNANTLVNLISRRVRQLNSGGGGFSRPLVANTENQGVADIALREIIDEKMGWELPEWVELPRPVNRKRVGIRSGIKALRGGSQQVLNAVAA